jgi:murein DD-endopeptidase MepM/ murein hydrolase activator NlpD
MSSTLFHVLQKHQAKFGKVVSFNNLEDRLLGLDLSFDNKLLTPEIFEDLNLFGAFIQKAMAAENFKFAIGGYNEHRPIYSRSTVFDDIGFEPRRLHLGIDIWGEVGTPIFAPFDGTVHSLGYHPQAGDYGATLLLAHQLEGVEFFTLYGHLSKADLNKEVGTFIEKGNEIAHFGAPEENGFWPPHLHFQVIGDLGGSRGDYPGVCKLSERDEYLINCPDPDLILQLNQYVNS